MAATLHPATFVKHLLVISLLSISVYGDYNDTTMSLSELSSTQDPQPSNATDAPADQDDDYNDYYSDINFEELPAKKLAEGLWLYGSPILMILGAVGNAMSAIVMLRKGLRKSTTSVYLTVLAFVDTLVLYTGLLRQWLQHMNGSDVRTISAAGCKLHIFLVYAFGQFEAWILVIVTFERLVAVFLPHNSNRIFTRPCAVISLIVTGVLLAALNMHFFWTNELVVISSNLKYCMPYKKHYEHFMRRVWPWLDFSLFSLVPFTILIVCNVAILIKMAYIRYLHKRSLHSQSKITSMTIILVTVSFTFFFTTAPISVYLIISDKLHANANIYTYARLEVVWALVNLLAYTNNAINFLLYCLSGSRFRRELIAMFCRSNRVKPAPPASTMTDLPMKSVNTVA